MIVGLVLLPPFTQESLVLCHREAKEMTVTQRSKWKERWQKLRENNPVSDGEYHCVSASAQAEYSSCLKLAVCSMCTFSVHSVTRSKQRMFGASVEILFN